MMGADSVAYHQATVMGRADDFPGQALAYYASRGETPLRWGGSGAGLGRSSYSRIFWCRTIPTCSIGTAPCCATCRCRIA